MEAGYLKSWPDFWPPPDAFFGPLAASIAGLHTSSQSTEQHVIVRFKNLYGVRISQSRLHDGLYVVAALKFYGPKLDEYDLVNDAHLPDHTWCFNSEEVYMLCEEVAFWNQ